MTTVLAPLRDYVAVSLRDLPEKVGSLYRIGTNEIARQADVVAIGPEVRDVMVGQGVVVNPLSGQWAGDNLLVPEDSILGYLDG